MLSMLSMLELTGTGAFAFPASPLFVNRQTFACQVEMVDLTKTKCWPIR